MNQRPVSLALAFSATLVGCDVDLGPRAQVEDRTFGQIVYREACQRVLYSEELARASTASGMGVTAPTIDVSGTRYRLRLSGSGQWSPAKLRFRGDARAAEGSEAVLNNLLNLMGQRQGALALLAIG